MIVVDREPNGRILPRHDESVQGRMSPEYRAWKSMKRRCLWPSHTSFHRYGGRGITVCAAWIESYEAFLAHVGRRPSPAHSLDRIDNERGYEPGNVRWATRDEQNSNRGDNHLLTFNGVTRCLATWAKEIGVSADTLSHRLRHGWSVERTLSTPVRADEVAR